MYESHELRHTMLGCIALLCVGATHAQDSTSTSMGTIRKFVNSAAIKEEGEKAQTQFSKVARSVDDAAVAVAKRALPSMSQQLGQLKYGTHNVVSEDGEQVIALIRTLINSKTEQDKKTIFAQLREFNNQGIPEATNFIGFVTEYGLWGARRDPGRAVQFYTAAAAKNYQPAIYNLGLSSIYKNGGTSDLSTANKYMESALKGFPQEDSYRVCGFSAFLAYRRGDQNSAVSIAKTCPSPLAMLGTAITEQIPVSNKVEILRKTIGTGVTDGYNLLERVTKDSAESDYLYCKYRLVNQHRKTPLSPDSLMREAADCVDRTNSRFKKTMQGDQRQMVIRGITAFVPAETAALQNLAKANPFHYEWSVPYLPFRQVDVELFQSIIDTTTK